MTAHVPDNVRIQLRPVGNPLPLSCLGLLVATTSFASLQLGWVPASESRPVALAVLALTVPAQALACVLGFFARDPVAGTGTGVLAGAWAGTALVTLTSPPGSTSPGLGVALVVASLAMLVPAVAGRHTLVAALVLATSATRFALTGVAELAGTPGWLAVAGWSGLVLAAVALYAALAFELEGADTRSVLPLGRRGAAARAVSDDEAAQLAGVVHEPGVRVQL